MPAPGASSRGGSGCASWEAFATGVVLRLTDPGQIELAVDVARRELDAIDGACSRFRADSELSRLSASEGRATRVSALLLEALELALRAARLTDGDLDPTIGRALELAGYDRDLNPSSAGAHGAAERSPAAHAGSRAGARPARFERVLARSRAGWQALSVDARSATVRVPQGVRLDLGATAKAWAADRAARAVAAAAGCGVLVSVGGDIATCGPAPRAGWRVHVTDDHRSDASAPGQTIAISCGGLATSSTTVRRWRRGGRAMHHILDPRTAEPADGRWRTVSVAAASCAEANIASTAAIVRGEGAMLWLRELGLPARLVDRCGRAYCLGEWPEARPRERCA